MNHAYLNYWISDKSAPGLFVAVSVVSFSLWHWLSEQKTTNNRQNTEITEMLITLIRKLAAHGPQIGILSPPIH